MCQPLPTGRYTCWDFDPQTNRFTPRQNKILGFEIIFMSYFHRTRPNSKKQTIQQAEERKMTALVLMVFVLIATKCSEQLTAFAIFVPVKKFVLPSLKTIFNVVVK